VAELIRQLGSDEFAVRERASARLAALDAKEPPAELLRAASSPDPEVRRRAAAAAKAIRDREVARVMGPAGRFAAAGALDRYVASSAAWDLPADDERVWKPLRDLVPVLVGKAGYRGEPRELAFTINRGDGAGGVTVIRSGRPYRLHKRVPESEGGRAHEAVIAPEVTVPAGDHLYAAVSRGPVRVDAALNQSVVLANGDVSIGVRPPYPGICAGSIVVADGNVEVGGKVIGALIVARGDILIHHFTEFSRLVAGGRVTVKNQIDIPKDQVARVGQIEEHQPNPFGFVTWFELSQVGVEAAKGDGGVAVKALAAGKPFAAAGVRAGDLVTKVGEHPVATPEEFRRRVRDGHAVAAEATLAVRRDGQPLTVRVALPH
jgi:hypothetical protein